MCVYERVKTYWGTKLNVNRGRDNFDELHYEYFRDATVAIEALKADQVDWRIENSAKNWASAYDGPAIGEKRIVLEEFPIRNVGVMLAFAFNIRRDKFKDPAGAPRVQLRIRLRGGEPNSYFSDSTPASRAKSKAPISPLQLCHRVKS